MIGLNFLLLIRNYKNLEIKKNLTTNTNQINIKNLSLITENENMFKDINVIFFIDLVDFSCSPCENQVINLCKWIDSNTDTILNKKVLLFVRKRHNNIQYYKYFIGNWLKENKINLQVKLDNNDTFNKIKVSKTSIAIFKGNDYTLTYYKEFPLPKGQLEEMKKIIKSQFITKTMK